MSELNHSDTMNCLRRTLSNLAIAGRLLIKITNMNLDAYKHVYALGVSRLDIFISSHVEATCFCLIFMHLLFA